MRCRDVQTQLRRDPDSLSAGARVHLASCESCQLLAEQHGSLAKQLTLADPPGLPDFEEMFAQTQQAIEQEQKGLRIFRNMSLAMRFAIVSVLTLLLLAVMGLKPRIDIQMYPMARMILASASFLVVGFLGIWMAFRPIYRPPWSGWQIGLLWFFAMSVPLLLGLLPPAHHAHPESLAGVGMQFFPRVAKCLSFGLVIAFLFLFFARRFEPRDSFSWSMVFTASLSAGLIANMALQLRCPIVHSDHLLVGHAPIGILVFLGSAAVLSLLRWRSQKQREAQ